MGAVRQTTNLPTTPMYRALTLQGSDGLHDSRANGPLPPLPSYGGWYEGCLYGGSDGTEAVHMNLTLSFGRRLLSAVAG